LAAAETVPEGSAAAGWALEDGARLAAPLPAMPACDTAHNSLHCDPTVAEGLLSCQADAKHPTQCTQ
jgi:hypothetical protein